MAAVLPSSRYNPPDDHDDFVALQSSAPSSDVIQPPQRNSGPNSISRNGIPMLPSSNLPSPRWNGPTGWSIYFPSTTESDSECAGRARVVSLLKQAFVTDQRYHNLFNLPHNSSAVPIDYGQFTHSSAHPAIRSIANAMVSDPELAIASIGLAACRAAEDLAAASTSHADSFHVAAVDHRTKLQPRILNFSPLTALRSLKGASVGTFVAVQGTIVRVSTIRQQIVSMQFQCGRCGESQLIAFSDYKYSTPTSCPTDRCRSRNFTPLRSTAETVDWQRIRIQELQQREQDGAPFEEGRIPRTIDAELFSDLIDSCVPGDIATVCGIVKVMTIDGLSQPRNSKSLFYMYIEANSVNTMRNRSGVPGGFDALAAPKVHKVIQEIVLENDAFGFLVHSAVPSIYGHELVKAGLLLALFGGATRNDVKDGSGQPSSDRVAIRRDIHVLVVGDPGLGKSQMLKAFCNIAPRGVYVCGNTSSTAGLTVTVVREATGDFALEAGALVLGDGGVCCIDEFDKMGAEHGALLEAMEQQSVSVAKAGLLCNLSARTTVLAAANPVGGHYDRAKTVCENLKIALPLLSRFDLVFILMDKADAARDRFISEHVMRTFGRRRRNASATGHPWRGANCSSADVGGGAIAAAAAAAATQAQAQAVERDNAGGGDEHTLEHRLQGMRVKDPLPPNLFREYVSYARTHVHPQLTDGAKRVLKDYYLELRRASKSQAADTTPVTTRQLESMVRLSEARARAVMRTIVTASDAKDVVEIMRKCMISEMLDASGTIDFGRASGMSRSSEAKKFVKALDVEARRKECANFTHADLKRIAKAIGVGNGRFSTILDSVNNQGFIIKKAGGRWELQGSDFTGRNG